MGLRWKRPQALAAVRVEIEEALAAVRAAEARLNEAEGMYVEVAVLELTAAEKRLNCLLRLARAGAAI